MIRLNERKHYKTYLVNSRKKSSNNFVDKYFMKQWVNVTNIFAESQMHYKNTYLEIYFSFGIMYGIVYTKEEDVYKKREHMKTDLEQEYRKNNEPSEGFINSFAKKCNVCLPNDVLFDDEVFLETFMNI